MRKLLLVAGLLITVVALIGACGEDPTPTPMPTPTPTATPVPTATPIPEPMGNAGPFVLTDETIGQDLIDVLSVEEQDCIRTSFGDAFYEIMLQLPLAQPGADPTGAAPLFNCLTPENTINIGVPFLAYGYGGWTPETTSCAIEVIEMHPAILTDAFGITNLPTEPADAVVKHRHSVLMYNCMTVEEQARSFAATQVIFDGIVDLNAGLLDLLSEAETTCIQDGLSEEEWAALPQHTLLSAFESPSGDVLSDCISDETFVNSFIVINETLLQGDMTDDTRTCLTEFASNHPLYVQAAKLGYYDFEEIPTDEYAELANDGQRVYDCLTDDELLRMQNSMALP